MVLLATLEFTMPNPGEFGPEVQVTYMGTSQKESLIQHKSQDTELYRLMINQGNPGNELVLLIYGGENDKTWSATLINSEFPSPYDQLQGRCRR